MDNALIGNRDGKFKFHFLSMIIKKNNNLPEMRFKFHFLSQLFIVNYPLSTIHCQLNNLS